MLGRSTEEKNISRPFTSQTETGFGHIAQYGLSIRFSGRELAGLRKVHGRSYSSVLRSIAALKSFSWILGVALGSFVGIIPPYKR